jgi:hypothetical protein
VALTSLSTLYKELYHGRSEPFRSENLKCKKTIIVSFCNFSHVGPFDKPNSPRYYATSADNEFSSIEIPKLNKNHSVDEIFRSLIFFDSDISTRMAEEAESA